MSSTDSNLHQTQKKLTVDWSDLPADLLRPISKKLYDVCDFVRFRSDCKSWRIFTTTLDLPSQVPWLLKLPSDRDGEYLHFCAVFSDNKVHTIRRVRSHGKHLNGLLHGYLTYLYTNEYDGEKHYSLVNPLIKHEVALQFEKPSSHYVFLCTSSGLIEDGDFMSFRDDDTLRMVLYQPHKSKRNNIKGPFCDALSEYIEQACFMGKHFTSDQRTGTTEVFDITHQSSFVIPPPPIPSDLQDVSYQEQVFFVESEGNILRIVKIFKWNGLLKEDKVLNYGIYRLDVEEYIWIKINGIGNQILFLDCIRKSGISITASESTDSMKNCIYYIECHGVFKYDIKSGQTQKVVQFDEGSYIWFVPSLVGFPLSSPN